MGVKENHFKKSLQSRNLNLIKIQTDKITRGATVQMIYNSQRNKSCQNPA